MFYEFKSRGMPREMRPKYKAFLTGMRVGILEGRTEARSDSGMDVVQESGDGSEVFGEVEQLDDVVAFSPADDAVKITTDSQEEIADISLWELSTTPAEVKTSTLKSEAKSDSPDQTTNNPPLSKKERKKLKRKEERKRPHAQAKLLSQSKDTMEIKVTEELRENQNQKREEKRTKANAAAGWATGL